MGKTTHAFPQTSRTSSPDMIKQSRYPMEKEAAPQAMFWRPIKYFSPNINNDEDNLDKYLYLSYILDNNVFDLRVYRGQPQSTVALYMPEDVEDLELILHVIMQVMEATTLPLSSLAWKRGDVFEYGQLNRAPKDRLREPEARVLALKIASQCEDYTASMEFIKNQVPNYYSLSALDEEPSPSRNREKKWQQIVGNVQSHSTTRYSVFNRGLAVSTEDGIRVTRKGLDYLNSIGFVS